MNSAEMKNHRATRIQWDQLGEIVPEVNAEPILKDQMVERTDRGLT